MGWAGGSELLGQMIRILQEHVPDDSVREDIYIDMINAFEDADCDTVYELLGEDEAFDAAYHLINEDDDDGGDEDEDLDLEDDLDV
jgi:hypothetical protein